MQTVWNYDQEQFTNKRLKLLPHPLQADSKDDEKGHCRVVIGIFFLPFLGRLPNNLQGGF